MIRPERAAMSEPTQAGKRMGLTRASRPTASPQPFNKKVATAPKAE